MIGYFSLVYMRTNLGLAMTCMVNSTVQVLKADVDDPEVLHDHVQTSQGCQAGNVKASDGHSIAVVNDYGVRLLFKLNIHSGYPRMGQFSPGLAFFGYFLWKHHFWNPCRNLGGQVRGSWITNKLVSGILQRCYCFGVQ